MACQAGFMINIDMPQNMLQIQLDKFANARLASKLTLTINLSAGFVANL